MADEQGAKAAVAEPDAATPPCCPPGSIGPTANEGYESLVEEVVLMDGELPMYVRKPPGWNGGKAILVLHDVFGPNSGRTKQICDEQAAHGYLVVMPVLWQENLPESYVTEAKETWRRILHQASALFPTIKFVRKHRWTRVGPMLTDHAVPWMVEQGASQVAIACYCYGCYPMVYLLAENKANVFVGGVGFHPSLQVFVPLMERSKPLLEKIDKPLMMLSAGGDPGDIKPGGFCEKEFKKKETSLHEKCVFKLYPDMQHGWVNRGDLKDEKIARDYKDAREISDEFISKLFE